MIKFQPLPRKKPEKRFSPGVCPNCNVHGLLTYGKLIAGPERKFFSPFICRSCGVEGNEVFTLEYYTTIFKLIEEAKEEPNEIQKKWWEKVEG